MKRFVGILCASLLTMAFAGGAEAAKMYAGVKGGANFGDTSGSDAPDNASMRTGIQGGGYFGCDVNDQFGVRGEVLYVQKGVKGDFLTDDGDIHPATYKIDYVDIPVLFDARFAVGEKVGFDVFAGPSFNFNAGAKAVVQEHGTLDLGYVKSFEFGAVVGGGARYQLPSLSIVADVRYSLGASSISEDVDGQSVDVKNRGIGLMAGLEIPLGSE